MVEQGVRPDSPSVWLLVLLVLCVGSLAPTRGAGEQASQAAEESRNLDARLALNTGYVAQRPALQLAALASMRQSEVATSFDDTRKTPP